LVPDAVLNRTTAPRSHDRLAQEVVACVDSDVRQIEGIFMLNNWINVTRVSIHGADRLYPKGLDWHVAPGVNAVVGGTGLGKTTLVYALQFAVFGKLVIGASERIEREFFRDRLTKRSANALDRDPPTVRVEFSVGSSHFALTRALLSGALLDIICDGEAIRANRYGQVLADKVGLKNDFDSLVRLQSYLFFFGESRYLLAWDNQLQHELISLMMSDHATYSRLGELWKQVESADSMARNLSAQAVRMERDLQEMLKDESNVDKLQQRSDASQLAQQQKDQEKLLLLVRNRIAKEQKLEETLDRQVAATYASFHRELSQLEASQSDDQDATLLAIASEDPTTASVRRALEEFYGAPNRRDCPCCGRPGIAATAVLLAEAAATRARGGNCVVCSKDLPQAARGTEGSSLKDSGTDAEAATLRTFLFQREQVRSRLSDLQAEESNALQALAQVREAALKHALQNPASAAETMRITIGQMRAREKDAKKDREQRLASLKRELSKTNAVFSRIQHDIATAFKKYASLYLDEPCDVKFLSEKELPGKRGPQVKAPHAAFFPVVSDQTRPSAQALSDAQRSFVDLAFRMAVIDVWHQTTNQTTTMIIETPEGAVDIAYMERVARMMRTFGEQGHTMIITTNLNNMFFLPEVMAHWPKNTRRNHILNMLEEGSPRQVQIDHKRHFDEILKKVDVHPRVI
jgi:hypothetical protein